MHVGVDSSVSTITDPRTERIIGPEERIEHLLEEITLTDTCGLHSFGIGEHHREEFYDSAPPVPPADHDALFTEKLDLLLKTGDCAHP